MATRFSGPWLTPGDLTSNSSTALADVGSIAYTPDGRAFRYAKVGAVATVKGTLLQASAEDTTNLQNLTVTAPTIGATSITTTTTVTLAADQAAGGWLVVTSATLGVGQMLKIKGNTAATAAVVTFTLEDAVLTTCTGTVLIDVIPSPYSGVVINPTTATSLPVGVATNVITAAYFGWIQTHGPAPILADGTVVVGTALVASNATAGAVEALTGVQAPVGLAITGIATTQYGIMFLTLD